MDHTASVHTHPTSGGGYSDGMWHQITSPPTEAARYVGGHVNVPPRESHKSSTAPASVLHDLTRCYQGIGQDIPFNRHTADLGLHHESWFTPSTVVYTKSGPYHEVRFTPKVVHTILRNQMSLFGKWSNYQDSISF